ncbi:pentapeptide repeat-containing protein [Mycobacterium sp. 236(2023)]|uniref:pentapeptide repeat-containing protein n=1 Tax=Mycobacterium sp. 236(2023) TaxID=3038163 RepID=UPI0024156BA5|nr:pentapeptide repeat-containing protein [Mycobacterium sp. 236(2023)]MDG4663225.1 pentapeptide repeat-containing protein [Mycobacterium sp. 236(2023)]
MSTAGPSEREPRWWVRDIVIAMILGVVLAAGSIWGQKLVDDSRAIRDEAQQQAQTRHAEQLENLVFVRNLSSSEPTQARPFSHMDLEGMALVGLRLPGADFAYANLTGAVLTDVYYDESTKWPHGFRPPPSRE